MYAYLIKKNAPLNNKKGILFYGVFILQYLTSLINIITSMRMGQLKQDGSKLVVDIDLGLLHMDTFGIVLGKMVPFMQTVGLKLTVKIITLTNGDIKCNNIMIV